MRQPVVKPGPKPNDPARRTPDLPQTERAEQRHFDPLKPMPASKQMHENNYGDRPKDQSHMTKKGSVNKSEFAQRTAPRCQRPGNKIPERSGEQQYHDQQDDAVGHPSAE